MGTLPSLLAPEKVLIVCVDRNGVRLRKRRDAELRKMEGVMKSISAAVCTKSSYKRVLMYLIDTISDKFRPLPESAVTFS